MDRESYHHKNLKNDLIEKGIELVNEYGMSQVSLRKVAQACNASHAAPYSHFSNKEELFASMQSYITDQFTNVLENTISAYKGKSDFLLQFGKAYISFFIDRPHYFTFLFQQGNMRVDLDIDCFDTNSYKPFLIYKEQVLLLLAHSPMSREKKEDYIIALFAYIHGLTALATMKNVNYSKTWESKLEDLIKTFSFEF